MNGDEYISAPVGGGLLLARRDTHRLFALNETGRFVWERSGLSPARIAEELADAYGIDGAVARRDVDAVLRQWREEGLVEAGRPGFICLIGGFRFRLRLAPAEVRDALGAVFSSFLADPAAGVPQPCRATVEVTERNGKYLVSTGGEPALLAPTLDAAVEAVHTGMIRHVFNVTDWRLSMHSAAVGGPEGCVLIAGESGRGKTTLVAQMLSLGLDYIADDLVLAVPPRLAVLPIPVPLVLKRGSWAGLEAVLPGLATAPVFRRAGRDVKYWSPPRERIAREPAPIKAILFPHFGAAEGLAETRLEVFAAISRLMQAPTRIGMPLDEEAVGRLATLVQDVPAYELAYSEAADAAQWAKDLIARR